MSPANKHPGPPATIKNNWREIAAISRDTRAPDRIYAHYLLERELAARLMAAPASQRGEVYGAVYNELFARLSDHPQNTRNTEESQAITWQLSLLRNLVPAGARFAEIGAGDAKVSLGLCDLCSETVAFDVSDSVLSAGPKPANFRFEKIDGLHLPFPTGSFDFVYSNQLMEHLHPDDAIAQLSEIHRVLRSGGVYLCITPNRHTGPHDVSKYYDATPTGFHLKEYTYADLSRLFRDSGFSRTAAIWKKGRRHIVVPGWAGMVLETVFARLFRRGSGPVTQRVVRNIMGVNLIGYKT
ncbi:class I SAM-dependent methyltransferase [Bosea lathyri]|uniref:Ubiquinone/menaquinone biosynthesis C-methylase UbiE n=1 Tax=Bosea lathyri TaxID=1036778 RepID=A0A1H6BHL5_9HYPH|nr:class I SAM-dependent methyltransferase [Bosea lathyri]SEG60134.1 Ubiquinone/menaquinone biosynthesis C-methylase UbiE [Bosea lathyri]